MYITKVSYLLKYLTNYNQLALTCYYHTFFYYHYNNLYIVYYVDTYTRFFLFNDMIRTSMPPPILGYFAILLKSVINPRLPYIVLRVPTYNPFPRRLLREGLIFLGTPLCYMMIIQSIYYLVIIEYNFHY